MADTQQPVEHSKTPADQQVTSKTPATRQKKSKTRRCGQSYRRENEYCSRGAEKGSYRGAEHHCEL